MIRRWIISKSRIEGVSKRYQNVAIKPRRRPYLPFMRTRRALRSALRDSGSVAMMFERFAAM